jgi:hypothetical protein
MYVCVCLLVDAFENYIYCVYKSPQDKLAILFDLFMVACNLVTKNEGIETLSLTIIKQKSDGDIGAFGRL